MSQLVLLVLAGVCGAGYLWGSSAPSPEGAGIFSAPAPRYASSIPTLRGSLLRGRRDATTISDIEVARLMERLAAAVRSGATLQAAWKAIAATTHSDPLRQLAHRMADGGVLLPGQGVQSALRTHPALSSLELALRLCHRTGAPTAAVLHRIAGTVRDMHDADRARDAAFAGPHATARLLLLLPIAGIALGTVIGVNPIRVLTTTATGLAMLTLGLILTAAGWWWMHRLIRRATGPRHPVEPALILDLLAAPLSAGSPLSLALAEVGECVEHTHPGNPIARALRHTAAAISAGVPLATACARLPEELSAVREAAIVAEHSGADLAAGLRSASEDIRRDAAREAEARAAGLAVQLVIPTGLTLLPAFVILGIIPTVSSLLGSATSDAFGL